MKNTLTVAALLCAACHAPRPSETSETSEPAQSIHVTGLEQPESALHDTIDDVYLVSNVAGSPFEKDGRGFISRISSAGKLLEKEWISGLDAPKGLALHGDTLAVADLTVLRRFDRKNGAVIDVIPLEGATFLNDVTSAPDGSFLVSDSGFRAQGEGIEPTGSDAIYRVDTAGNVTRLVAGAQLALPNGLTFLGDELLMAPFGAAKLLRFAADGTPRGEVVLPAGQLDGLVALSDGCLLVSSFEAGGVLHGRLDGSFSTLLPTLTMDIGLDARRDVLLMPMMMENRLQLLPLAGRGACQ